MFNDSYLRACMKLWIVQKITFSLLESGQTKPWCPGLVSGPSAKAQETVARSRGLVIQPPKLSVGAYFELSFLGCGFLIQGPSIVLPVWRCIKFSFSYLRACMKLRIVQKIRFSLLESGRTKAWCPSLVSRPSAKAQEPVARISGLVIQPPKLSVGAYFELSFLGQLVHILSFRSQGVGSLFIFPTGTIALDSEPRGRRYVKNTGHNSYCLYSRAIHCPAIMEMHYVQ